MTKRAILHIPHSEMLVTHPFRYWVERFENTSRIRPTEIALPAVGYLGPSFASRVHGFPSTLKHGNLLADWVQQARDVLGADIPIWASIVPAYPFLEVETVMITDQYGIRFDSQACIANPTVQKITDVFLAELIEIGIHGVAFDLTDIFPNSGSNVINNQIQNTCFCPHCLRQLESAGWKQRQRPFLGKGNISRFVLRLTPTGADHISPRHEWIRDTDAAALVQFSEARGFVDETSASIEDAEHILRYLAARGQVTANAVRRLGMPARAHGIKVAAMLGDANFDMTQCTDVASLFSAESASEFWLPSIDSETVQTKGIVAVQYLCGRGPYTLDAFFEQIGKADQSIASSGVEGFIARILRMSRIMLQANRLTAGAAFTVEWADEYSGFVGTPIGRDDAIMYIERLTSGTLGQIVPRKVIDQIIEQVKLGSPDRDGA